MLSPHPPAPKFTALLNSDRTVLLLCLLAFFATFKTKCASAQDLKVADDGQSARRLAHQFETEIRPVLVGKCIECHGHEKQEGGLRLDSLEAILTGGDSGPAIVPGNAHESILVDAVHHRGYEMPPTGKLADKTLFQIQSWVENGAFWPDNADELRPSSSVISGADRDWWAFQPLSSHDVPVQGDDGWSKTDIDRFVYDSLKKNRLNPAPAADKTTLIRRVYFDLIGLPPTPEEIDAFLADDAPDALERRVDQLLDDPRYGEHWSRFWLDLVRFSESDGWNKDSFRPLLWQYRDYVVDAFNRDMPYTQFVQDQLAGDESINENPDGLIAAGFLRLGVYEYNQRNARGQWNDILNEMTDVTADVFFGVSVSCARCHNHKFDPIPQEDYFKLRAFLEPIIWTDELAAATDAELATFQSQQKVWEDATVDIRARLALLLEPYEKARETFNVSLFPPEIQACYHMPRSERTSWQEQMAYLIDRQYWEEHGGPYRTMSKEDVDKRKEIEEELAAFDHLKPAPLKPAMSVTTFDGLHTPTRIPGDTTKKVVQPGFLAVLDHIPNLPTNPTLKTVPSNATSYSTRRSLAEWITHPDNPLTTRVIVNRIWQQHFGEGLVRTSSDFGQLGDTPSHPELLDWLTRDFIDNGWTMKRLHKHIVLSATWQQSAKHPLAAEYAQVDPDDKLLWRSKVRRLKAEQIRDAMLVATDELQNQLGGSSVSPTAFRRSLYLESYRNRNDTFLHGFDLANGLQSVAVRDVTTTPMQALLLLNGSFTRERAEALSKQVLTSSQSADEAIENAFRKSWGWVPSNSDRDQAIQFLGVDGGEAEWPIDPIKFGDFCHVLLNSNQFLYLE